MLNIILASSSPNRKELLSRLLIDFTSISPHIDESPRPEESPENLALRLSIEKAQVIAASHPQTVVIGSDQVCAAGPVIINKPETHDNALNQWQHHLCGQTVTFYTGVAVCFEGTCVTAMVPTQLKFKSLPLATYESYLLKDQPYGCCAGFKIERLGISLVEWVKSEDPTALIGLPLIKTIDLLSNFNIKLP